MTESRLAPDHPDAVAGGELRLPKPPGVFRQFWARHPRLTDGLIAGIYGVPTIIGTIVTAVQYGLPALAHRRRTSARVVAAGAALAAVPAHAAVARARRSPGSRAWCPPRRDRSTSSRSCSRCTRSPCTRRRERRGSASASRSRSARWRRTCRRGSAAPSSSSRSSSTPSARRSRSPCSCSSPRSSA